MNVVRAAHAELLVADLDRAATFYGGLLGFVETERDGDALYLRGYEEREHHSLVLRRGARPAVSHIAYRVARPEDLDLLEERFRCAGLPWRRIAGGEERGQGAAVRVQDPCGLPVEFYHELEMANYSESNLSHLTDISVPLYIGYESRNENAAPHRVRRRRLVLCQRGSRSAPPRFAKI